MDTRLSSRALLAANALLATCVLAALPARAAAAEEPKTALILAHYMPWFTADPAGPTWGWHWTMNAFDPGTGKAGERRIASHFYPLIGPYDSGDPAVLEYHLLLMKLAEIDGVVADWYGLSNHADYPVVHRNTAALFRAAAKVRLRVAVCYEDQTVSRLVEAKKLAAPDRVKHAREEIAWVRKNWFADPAYVRLDAKPLLLSFGNDGLTDLEWEQVLPREEPDAPLYLSEHRRRGAAAGAFDWPVPKDHPAGLDRYYKRARDWPVAMPVAFPRFHDIYAEANVHASWGRIPDDEGRTFVTTLRRALASGAPLVQIATWNDWGEGTNVEPSEEFGYRDLEAVQRLRRDLVDAGFPFKPDDLRLAHRLFVLRRQQAGRPGWKDDLDQVARLLATGAVSEARSALSRLEAGPR